MKAKTLQNPNEKRASSRLEMVALKWVGKKRGDPSNTEGEGHRVLAHQPNKPPKYPSTSKESHKSTHLDRLSPWSS